MGLNFVLVVFALIEYSLSDRRIIINNQCQQTIWMGVQGNPQVEGGGFKVTPNSKKEIQVPDKWVSTNLSIIVIFQLSSIVML